MQFRTELNPLPTTKKISYHDKIVTIGSCFSQVIGERLLNNKFEVLVNPFGTIFNPISIFRLLQQPIDKSIIDGTIENKGAWFNHHVHSSINATSKELLNLKLNDHLNQFALSIKNATTLIITLGTAFVYKQKSTNELVANCHKIPSDFFTKSLLSTEDIVVSFGTVYAQLKKQSPGLEIILTVSPVRHTKDTLELNSLSKSILRLACHEISQQFSDVLYFPSYELMMDDLRDYRFYKEDMIHPSEVAEEYIWNKFSELYFNTSTNEIIKEWSSVSKALQHKPFREDSQEYKKFLSSTLKRLELLEGKINVVEEITTIKNNYSTINF